MTPRPSEATSLGEIVARDFRAAAIFDRYGLDYCCGGAHTLAEGCSQRGVSVARVLSDLEALAPDSRESAADADPVALVDYILSHHHAYVRRSLPLIQEHLAKVVAAHGERHSELQFIETQVSKIARALSLHMVKEEQVLFPYIRALAAAVRSDGPPPPDMFGTVQNPIRMMEIEHQEVGDDVAAVRELSHDYQPPSDACATYRLVLEELLDFERDLHRHVHLENNVLFPKTVELESTVDLMTRGLTSHRWE